MEYYIPTTLLAVIVTLLIGLYIRGVNKAKRYWKDRGIPFAQSLNIIANTKELFCKPMHELFLKQYKELGRVYGSFEFRTPVLTVCEPDLLRDILVKDFHVFSTRRDMDFGDKVVNKMISALKGEDWKRVRTIVTPAFTSKKMRQMSHIINECSQTVVQNFKKYADKGEPADVKGIFGAFTLDVIARSAFATKLDSHNDPENIFVKQAKDSFAEPSTLRILGILALFFLPTWVPKLLGFSAIPSTQFFKDVIAQVVKERRGTGKKYDDILQLLLEAQEEVEKGTASDVQGDEVDQFGSITANGTVPRQKYKKLDEDELVAQCILFFVVGYETTASTLSYIAYCLALNPECQEKLIAEVDDVSAKHEELNYDVIRDMKYLDCVVSETLRMYPSLTRSERTAVEDYKLGDTGIVIEKGTLVGFNIHAMHMDPELFPNPEKFDPERFLPENATHHQYAYLPFGAGPRNCLGMRFALMEMKLCISNILRHYRFKKAETTEVPLIFKKGQGLLSVNVLPLTVEKRTEKN